MLYVPALNDLGLKWWILLLKLLIDACNFQTKSQIYELICNQKHFLFYLVERISLFFIVTNLESKMSKVHINHSWPLTPCNVCHNCRCVTKNYNNTPETLYLTLVSSMLWILNWLPIELSKGEKTFMLLSMSYLRKWGFSIIDFSLCYIKFSFLLSSVVTDTYQYV